MSRKKRKRKQPGHFCWVCGRQRPNEKFSGRGHARHVCRECAKLGADELAYRQALRNLERCMTWEGNGPAIVWSGACSAIRLNGRLAACLLWPVPAVQPNAQLNSSCRSLAVARSHSSLPYYRRVFKPKMIFPVLRSRIEKRRYVVRFRINRAQVTSLANVAEDECQSEI